MSRRLPIVGGNAGARRDVPQRSTDPIVSTLMVGSIATVAVVGASADAGAEAFVQQLVAAIGRSGREARVERTPEPASGTRLLVILGSHVPRAKRRPEAQALWERADLLLTEPSVIVAEALARAL